MSNIKTKPPIYSDGYKRYVLLVLTGVYIFNFIDRQILVILQESIKEDLGLSDTQLGLLTGFAFAIFYVTLGLPIARLADKYNRKRIIAISLTVWSAMTALSGRAMNFTQLLLARIGVGIGEAGASPPAHSIISDYFPANRRATALATYSTGIYIGILLGYLFGGWLDEYFGWRMALMLVGVPGIIYALFFYFTVQEPPRGYSENIQAQTADEYSIWEVFRLLMSRKAFVCLALAAGFNAFLSYGIGNWLPALLGRLHGMESGEIGTWLALGSGGGGIIGVWLGGYLGDRFGQQDKRWYLWIPAISMGLSLILAFAMVFAPSKYGVVIPNIIVKVLWATYLGPCIAMAHGMVGLRMRALASAVLFLFLNLIGLGLGPLVIGALSDYLTPAYGVYSIQYAMGIALLVGVLSAFLYWRGAAYLREDLSQAPR